MFINKYKKSFISCVIIFYLLATLFLVLFCLRIMVSNAANSVIEGEKYSKIEPTSFLILGTDAAQTHAEGARSDVMMVATFNQSNSRGNMELNLISIPRDTIMKNTCSGEYEKANGIYNYGYQTSEVEGVRQKAYQHF